jgi:hypothetical protein
VLVAYLHRSAGAPAAGIELLRDFVQHYAAQNGFDLDSVFVGSGGQAGNFTTRDLLEHVQACGARTVIVSGPADHVLSALRRLGDVRILMLRDLLTH